MPHMNSQIAADGRLRHLLDLESLPLATLDALLRRAQHFTGGGEGPGALAGMAVCTLFFEPSTRTRLSFQLAALRLGADIVNFDASTSSSSKGETDLDTFRTVQAMGVRGFVIRHKTDGAVAALAQAAAADVAVINAGDGRSHHPSQGLLDMLTLRQAKGEDFSKLKVLIVGDVKHSRVARSDLHALRALGAGEIRVCGPWSLLPEPAVTRGCTVTTDLDAALEGVDAVMTLRLQRERMESGLVASLEDYHRDYGLTATRLQRAAADAIVMHPGPMNRGVEIDADVADGPQSRILSQVANGVAVRMAVLEELLA